MMFQSRENGGAAAQEPSVRLRVVDGDTFQDRATGERIRLENIDTPETGGRENCAAERQAGERATSEARRLIAGADRVSVRRTGREDRYGRTIGFVEVDGHDIGRLLMDAGLARPWRGRREEWCAADGSLLP
ncbi:MAG: thermonuclease family protein [Terricaulis sp.]